MIHSAAADSYGVIGQMVGTLLARLKETFLMQGLTAEDREKQNEVQALLCGSLQVRTFFVLSHARCSDFRV